MCSCNIRFIEVRVLGLLCLVSASANAASVAYVAQASGVDEIVAIDTASRTVLATIDANLGDDPISQALSPNGIRLYTANVNSGDVSVIDTATNTVVDTIWVGGHPTDAVVVPTSAGERLYVSNGDGLFLIDVASNALVGFLPITGAANMALTPSQQEIYVIANQTIHVVNVENNSTTRTTTLGFDANKLRFLPDGTRAYIAGGDVAVLDAATGSLVETIPTPGNSMDVAPTPDGEYVYVAEDGQYYVSVIETAIKNAVYKVIDAMCVPEGRAGTRDIAISPDGAYAYVTAPLSETASTRVIDLSTDTHVDCLPPSGKGRDTQFSGAVDFDHDGIGNYVDEEFQVSSTRFSDTGFGGSTAGRIVKADPGTVFYVFDAPTQDQGIRVVVAGPANGQLELRVDGSSGKYILAPGEYILTSGSTALRAVSGHAEVEFLVAETPVTISVTAGSVVFNETVEDGVLTKLDLTVEAGTAMINGTAVEAGDTQSLPVAIEVDIKPGDETNCINNDGHGVIPVALLGNEEVDASHIDPASLNLEGLPVSVVGKGKHFAVDLADLNGDGVTDLLAHFADDTDAFVINNTVATVQGRLYAEFGSLPIRGNDRFCLVPPAGE